MFRSQRVRSAFLAGVLVVSILAGTGCKKSAKKTVTEYPEVNGKVTCAWWLRTSGNFVSISGSTISNVVWEPGDVLKPYHCRCEMEDKGVRPAIWIAVDTSAS